MCVLLCAVAEIGPVGNTFISKQIVIKNSIFNNTNGTTMRIWIWIGLHVPNPMNISFRFVYTVKLPKWPNAAFKNDYNKAQGRQLMYKWQ